MSKSIAQNRRFGSLSNSKGMILKVTILSITIVVLTQI